MEVSQMSDAVTHAVIGKVQSVEMGVSDSAALMHIFSTTLYTYPKLATVREIICNGWDGHIVAERLDIPLEITIDERCIVIRDFGPGIPHDKIGPVYGVFGDSTKRTDSRSTGGFGLGSKAPFSYTDNFEVVSNHGGLKSVYRVSKSSMAAGGKPSIDTMVQLPTEEEGIRVTIPLKTPHDMQPFIKHIREVLVLGGISAKLNGELVETLPTHETPTGYIISSFVGTLTDKINLRYGNVVYPIPRMEHYGEMWDQVQRNMSNLWGHANITFLAEPDTISIAPSREALIFTDSTVETIRQLLSKFNPQQARTSSIMTRQFNLAEVNRQIRDNKPAHRPDGLVKDIQMPAIKGASLQHASGPYAFQLRKAAIAHVLSQRSLVFRGSELVLKHAHHAVHTSLHIDKVVGKRFLKAAKQYQLVRAGKMVYPGGAVDSILQAVLMKNITSPLLAAVRANENMDLERLTYVDQTYRNASNLKFVNPLRKSVGGVENLMAFLYKRVLLARSKTAIKEFFDRRRYMKSEQMQEGWVVYQIPTSDKHYDSIQKTFEDLGYAVHMYVPARAVYERAPGEPETAEPKVKKASPKRKGHLTLWSARSGEEFKLTTARTNCKPDEHVFDPVAYVVLGQDSDEDSNWEDLSRKAQLHICKHWGKQVAVITSTQVAKLEAKGIPEVSKYVYQLVEDHLTNAADFRRYLAFGRHLQVGDRPDGRDGVLRYMGQHPELIDSLDFKFRFGISAETEAFIMLWEDRSLLYTRRNMPELAALAEKIPQHKLVNTLRQRIKDSGWEDYVNLDAVGRELKNRAAGDDRLSVPYQIVREMLKEGLAP